MSELDLVEIWQTPQRIPLRRGSGQWYWRYRDGGNHRIMATGAEGYNNLHDLLASLITVLDLDSRGFRLDVAEPQKVARDSGWHDVIVTVKR